MLSFTADEAWQLLPGKKLQSVHLSAFPQPREEYDDTALAGRWETLLKLRDIVLKELESARAGKQIGNSLEAAIRIDAPLKLHDLLGQYSGMLADIFIVSRVELRKQDTATDGGLEKQLESAAVTVLRAEGNKCQRCWKYYPGDDREVCDRCSAALK